MRQVAMVAAGELRLQGTAMYIRDDVEPAIKLIVGGQVPAQPLVTRTSPLGQAELMFHAAAQGIDGRPAPKIQLEPQR